MPTPFAFAPRYLPFTPLWKRSQAAPNRWKLFTSPLLTPSLDPDEARLRTMQGNVLKAHGRPYATLVMLRFDGEASTSRAFVRRWVAQNLLTSSWQQLLDQWDYKEALARTLDTTLPAAAIQSARQALDAAAARPFRTLAFTATGLAAMAVKPFEQPSDPAFTSRMELPSSRHKLGDLPALTSDGTADDPWCDDVYRDQRIDALLLLAHATPLGLADLLRQARQLAGQFDVHLVTKENGFAWKPAGGDMREPFGFADGITNPVFLAEDAAALPGPPPPVDWSSVAIDYDTRLAGGSYVVFRKLEQDMGAFVKFEQALGQALAGRLQRDPAEVLVGRDRSGAPLVTNGPLGIDDFDFRADRTSPGRCPFHAHIRKSNPRLGNSPSLVRRSLIYAEQGGPDAPTLGGRRGLLFLAYTSRIDSSFRAMQETWLMQADSQEPGLGSVGVDPLLAPGCPYTLEHRHMRGGSAKSITLDRPRLVIPRGGRYAFQPSFPWLARLPA